MFQDGIFESICIELGYSTGKVIRFVSIYWLPGSISYLNSVNSEFLNYYSNLLGYLSDQNFEIHIQMDSNIDLVKVNINPSSKRLILVECKLKLKYSFEFFFANFTTS